MEFQSVLDGEEGNQIGWFCLGRVPKDRFIAELTKQYGDPDYRFDIRLVNHIYMDQSGDVLSKAASGRTPVTLIEQVFGNPIAKDGSDGN